MFTRKEMEIELTLIIPKYLIFEFNNLHKKNENKL